MPWRMKESMSFNRTTTIGRFRRRSTIRRCITRRWPRRNRAIVADENNLTPGLVISTPPIGQLEKTYPSLCPNPSRRETLQNRSFLASEQGSGSFGSGKTYTVAEGDTLFTIARYELGKASRWAEIYELNQDVLGKDFNYLRPGMRLRLPGGEKSDVLTRRSGRDEFQR